VRPKLFKSQMWLLKKLGYKGLNMTELQPYLTGKKQGKVVGITFDDGYKSN
jgi:peptidoglycan/xylan/chitin deacetylase (PgdA/CDA1 family)